MIPTDVKNYRAHLALWLTDERDLSLDAVRQVLRERTKDGTRTLIARGRRLVEKMLKENRE